MADTHKHPENDPSHSHAGEKPPAKDVKQPKPAPKAETPKPAATEHKETGAAKKTQEAAKRAEGKTPKKDAKKAPTKGAPSKAAAKKPDVKIVEKATPQYVPRPKPTLTTEQKQGLALRRTIAGRRPWFRRQQWYEYKRLANSGWRKPTGIDSAMRRHFGYEQPVVRIGFAGPKSVRGLHPSGFREVYVEQVDDLKGVDPKTQAARISGRLGTRKLKLVYAEADKLGVRILNRRNLE